MKKLATAALALFVMAGAAFADPLEGTWRTAADDNGNSGLIEVAPCGEALCGTLIKSFDANGVEMASENIGKLIISETVASGENEYRGESLFARPRQDLQFASGIERRYIVGIRLCVGDLP